MTTRLRNRGHFTYHEPVAMSGDRGVTTHPCGRKGQPCMSTVVIKRSARRPSPEIPTGELAVDPPPEIPQAAGGRWQQALMALPMLGGSVAMAMMMSAGGRGGASNYVVGG